MTYRVYSGPPGTEAVPPMEKERWLYKEFGLLDEALGWARHVNDGGRVTLLIEGDDGTRLSKPEISAALCHPEEVDRKSKVATPLTAKSQAAWRRSLASRTSHSWRSSQTGQRASTLFLRMRSSVSSSLSIPTSMSCPVLGTDEMQPFHGGLRVQHGSDGSGLHYVSVAPMAKFEFAKRTPFTVR